MKSRILLVVATIGAVGTLTLSACVASSKAVVAPRRSPAGEVTELPPAMLSGAQEYIRGRTAGTLAIVLVHRGKTSIVQIDAGAGLSIPRPDDGTRYEIGSLSKTVSALVLQQAVIEGKVALTADLRTWLPPGFGNLAFGGKPVRVGHLIEMTSALPDNVPPRPVERDTLKSMTQWAAQQRATSTDDFLRALAHAELTEEPGNSPRHSNAAGALVGVLLERIYHQPYATLLAERIERPTNMLSREGQAPLAPAVDADGRAVPYLEGRATLAYGGLHYSLIDLSRYLRLQLDETNAAVRASHQPSWMTLDGSLGIASMWIWQKESMNGRRLRQAGGTFAFAAFMDIYPDDGTAVALVMNGSDDASQEALQRLSEDIVRRLPKAAH